MSVPEVCDCGQLFPLDADLGNFCTKCGVRKGIRRKISKAPPRVELSSPAFHSTSSSPMLSSVPVLRSRGVQPSPLSLSPCSVSSESSPSDTAEKTLGQGPPTAVAEELVTQRRDSKTETKAEVCTQCGKSYPVGTEDWLFCTECGVRKAQARPSDPKPEAKSPTASMQSSSSFLTPQAKRHPDSSPPPSRSRVTAQAGAANSLTTASSTSTAPPSLQKTISERVLKMFCHACGAPFDPAHDTNCTKCGARLNSKAAQEVQARKFNPASGTADEERLKELAKEEEVLKKSAAAATGVKKRVLEDDLEIVRGKIAALTGHVAVQTPHEEKTREQNGPKTSGSSLDEPSNIIQDPFRKKSAKEIAASTSSLSSSGGKNTSWIQYDATKIVFSDYEFKSEQHQVLDLFRKGQFGAHVACSTALAECSTAQLTKLLPVVACAIADTPIWAEGRCENLVKVLSDRSKSTPAVQQALHALKISGLLDHPWSYTEWLESIPTTSPLFKAAASCASQEVGYSLELPLEKKISHPFDDSFTITNFQVAKIFNSNARPRLIEPTGRTEKSDVVQVGRPFILKEGDDLRQDVACIHIMSMMNNLWSVAGLQHDGLAVKSPCYGCLALTDTLGCIEFVPNAVPLKMVKDAGKYSAKAISRMITTGAGAFVAAYILGVRDRHHDNILISKTDGSLFHIDFGYILGDQTTIDAGAFGITPDLKDVICSYGSVNWDLFVQLCVTAYKIIRDKSRLIISFAVMMMAPFQSQDSVRRIIAERLRLTLEEEAALSKIRKKVRFAPTKFKTKLKNVVHGIASSGK